MLLFCRTVSFYLSILSFDNFTQLWPFREILEVEAYVIGLGEVIEIARIELEQIGRGHRSD